MTATHLLSSRWLQIVVEVEPADAQGIKACPHRQHGHVAGIMPNHPCYCVRIAIDCGGNHRPCFTLLNRSAQVPSEQLAIRQTSPKVPLSPICLCTPNAFFIRTRSFRFPQLLDTKGHFCRKHEPERPALETVLSLIETVFQGVLFLRNGDMKS